MGSALVTPDLQVHDHFENPREDLTSYLINAQPRTLPLRIHGRPQGRR